MKIEPVNWPLETNQAMKSEILKDKVNELIRNLAPSTTVCGHEQTKVTKNGMRMCLDCHKFIGKA